jgi:hypothetical protein
MTDGIGRSAKPSFSPWSFWFACNSGIPQPPCAVSIWGFRDTELVASEVIVFPQLDPGHTSSEFLMNKTTFSSRWTRLTSIGFSIARADNGGDMYGGLMIDDFHYVVDSAC